VRSAKIKNRIYRTVSHRFKFAPLNCAIVFGS
jgi:hypothetical protein